MTENPIATNGIVGQALGVVYDRRPMKRRWFVERSAKLGSVGFVFIAGCPAKTNENAETVTVTAKPIPTFDASRVGQFSDVAPIERKLHGVINEFRVKNGQDSWGYDSGLADIARLHSRDMSERNYYSHENPDGQTATERTKEYGYDAYPIGENIAKLKLQAGEDEPEELARELVGKWKRSTAHRNELLSSRYVEEGNGIYISSDRTVFATNIRSGEDVEVT